MRNTTSTDILFGKNKIINISEVEKLFREYYKNNKLKFSKTKFDEFSKFLEIDFYDWVKGNLKQFLPARF